MLCLPSHFAYVMHVSIVITGCGVQGLHDYYSVAMVDCLTVSFVSVIQDV